MDKLFFATWDSVGQILVGAPIIYLLVILYIRIIGKRSTSQMNSFDWIVTVAMGSLVGNTIIVQDISLIEGGLAVITLMGLQYLLTRAMVFSSSLHSFVRSKPRLLYYNGEYLEQNLTKERVLRSEIMAAIREKGYHSMEDVHAVVLETDANLSVLPVSDEHELSTILEEVNGLPESLKARLSDD